MTNLRAALFVLLWCPVTAIAQSHSISTDSDQAPLPEFNATTRAVVLANRPARFTETEWLRMMERPLNRSLYPMWINQAMLDTLDAKALDLRFQYEMIPTR